MTQAPNPSFSSDARTSPAPVRPLRATLRRHRLLLLALFCIGSSLLLLAAPHLRRSYSLSATVRIKTTAVDALPELPRLPAMLLQQEPPAQASIHMSLTDPDAAGIQLLTLSASGPTRDAALVLIESTAGRFSTLLQHRTEELAGSYRTSLQKQQDRLSDQEQSATRAAESFRLNHPGILPDDPASIVTQFEKFSARLDEKQQRQQLIAEQITRLEEYKRNLARGASAGPLPAPLPAASSPPAAAEKPEADPEVLTLSAQLQLINDQLDEQLNAMHRTEQHPYVVDLRTKQVTLQKKLEAAKQRASNGQPPPADVRAPQPLVRSPDPSLAASQQVDLQLESLHAEQTTLDTEVHQLTDQKKSMQNNVDQVASARTQYQTLLAQQESVHKDSQAVTTRLADFDHRFHQDAGAGSPLIDISPAAIQTSSTLPAFPRLSLVYPVGLLAGFLAAVVLAVLLHVLDRTLHDPREAAAALDLPILGATSEIRSPAGSTFHRLSTILRPAAAAALPLLLLASAVLCFVHLANPQYPSATHAGVGTFSLSSLDIAGQEARP